MKPGAWGKERERAGPGRSRGTSGTGEVVQSGGDAGWASGIVGLQTQPAKQVGQAFTP